LYLYVRYRTFAVITAQPSATIGDWKRRALPPPVQEKGLRMQRRRHFEQQTSLLDWIVESTDEVRAHAAARPPGPDQVGLLKKIRKAETAVHLGDSCPSISEAGV
jgi:hypothetical protein